MEVMRPHADPLRPIPFTRERAMTELARCRRQFSGAVGSLELAVEILSRLGIQADSPLPAVLEDLLGRMEEAGATLHAATAMLGSPDSAGRSAG
jgi:hypothetical protein